MPDQHQPALEPETRQRASTRIANDSPAIRVSHLPSVLEVMGQQKKDVRWNTANLGLRLGADLTSAASAAVLVAPIITIIDRYVHTTNV